MGILSRDDLIVGDAEPEDGRPAGYYVKNDDDWPSPSDDDGVDEDALLALFAKKNTQS